MAIDTAHKRGSAIHIMEPWRKLAPFPDGSMTASDRLALVLLYSGIPAAVAAPTTPAETPPGRTVEVPARSRIVYPPERSRTVYHV